MRWRAIAISILLLAALAVVCNAQQTDYSGTAKLVLKLEKMPDMPPLPENPAKTGLVPQTFGYSSDNTFAEYAMPAAPRAPAVPQGTLLQATVLYSSDPAVKVNSTYTLKLDYDPQSMPYGLKDQLLDKLNPGAIVGVNAYTLDGGNIKVDASTPYWKRNIFIVDAPSTGTGQSRNPFRMDLTFRPFQSFPEFRMGDTTPTPTPTITPPIWPARFPYAQNPGFFDIIGRFLG